MGLKFYVHTDNHKALKEEIEDLDFTVEYEQTDLGYKGIVHDEEAGEDLMINACDSVSEDVVSLLVVTINTEGHADGVGYNYQSRPKEVERESKGNNPETWHGIVYDGMHLDAEDL